MTNSDIGLHDALRFTNRGLFSSWLDYITLGLLLLNILMLVVMLIFLAGKVLERKVYAARITLSFFWRDMVQFAYFWKYLVF